VPGVYLFIFILLIYKYSDAAQSGDCLPPTIVYTCNFHLSTQRCNEIF